MSELMWNPLATCPEGMRGRYEGMARSPGLAAIVRLKCLECCAWNAAEVSKCEIRSCALWKRRAKRLHQPVD